MKRLTTITALLLGASATVAGAMVPGKLPCVTQGEAQALVQVSLPDALDALGDACASALPPSATLRAGRAALVARYRIEADAAWPAARGSVVKLAGDELQGMDPDTLRPMMHVVVSPMVAKAIKVGDCPRIDRIASLLAPLPAANSADLIVQLIAMRGNTPKATLPLTICPDHG